MFRKSKLSGKKAMAGIADRLMGRGRSQASNWSNTGTFINKPSRGWIHPDEQLAPDAGVCYGVRYIGCMEVKQSMKSLDFETRTAVAKESISRVCDAAGLKTASKKNKRTKISRFLGDEPNLGFAGSNVNLTITTESLTLMIMESGEIIANHQMPGISFASGGDPDTMDFVAYVAKDPVNGRACFVLECGGGLAQDVITTVGQAFEQRFKQFLNDPATPRTLPDRLENTMLDGDAWGEDGEYYYNDRPGAKPPSPVQGEPQVQESNTPVSDNPYSAVKEDNGPKVGNLIDLDSETVKYANPTEQEPFTTALPGGQKGEVGGARPKDKSEGSPYHEEWFHGPLTRHQTEELLHEDGDFLVRESANSPGQYVLSGVYKGRIRHLLLVDPQGVVRTRDRTFTSVSHLVHYHLENGVPIVSQESELILKNPVVHAPC